MAKGRASGPVDPERVGAVLDASRSVTLESARKVYQRVSTLTISRMPSKGSKIWRRALIVRDQQILSGIRVFIIDIKISGHCEATLTLFAAVSDAEIQFDFVHPVRAEVDIVVNPVVDMQEHDQSTRLRVEQCRHEAHPSISFQAMLTFRSGRSFSVGGMICSCLCDWSSKTRSSSMTRLT